jgi:carbon starvation protein CstA
MSKLRPADLGAGAAGVALLVTLFLPWYGGAVGTGVVAYGPGATQRYATGWEAFGVVDILLAIAALVAIALVVVTATARGPAKPVAFSVISTLTSALAVVLVLWRVLDPPEPGLTRHYGAWLALVVALLMFVASFAAMRDERTPGAVPPDVPRRPVPPA